MKKLAISRCGECTNYDIRYKDGSEIIAGCGYREGTFRQFGNPEIIPEWCPLDDVIEFEEIEIVSVIMFLHPAIKGDTTDGYEETLKDFVLKLEKKLPEEKLMMVKKAIEKTEKLRGGKH